MSQRTGDEGNDAELMRGIARADEIAFRALHDRFHGPVHGFAQRIVGSVERADEVTNDTMLAVWRGADAFEGRAKVSTWIFGIAYRIAHKALRDTGVERGRVGLDDIAPMADPRQRPLDTELYHIEIRAALGALPVELRVLVELTYYHGHSVTEAARIVGVPSGTVKSRMHAARARLREVLDAEPRP